MANYAKSISRTPDLHNMAVVLQGNAAQSLSVSTAAAQTAVISDAGIYDVWCSTDVYLKIGPAADDVTVATGYLLRAGATVPFFVGEEDRIGAIALASGQLKFHKVN